MEETLEEGAVNPRDHRFRILVCVDGSDESYKGLRYAAKIGRGVDADIVLVYVRLIDQGLRSGGLQVRVARENMLKWGLELPGIKYLKKGRDMLIELGNMGDDWSEKSVHTGVEGDPLGDNKIEYTNEQGKLIVLKLKVASNVATGILEQWELGHYDLIILGAGERRRGIGAKLMDSAVASRIVTNAPCSVLVARDLEIGNGHLICVDGSEKSLETARRDAALAQRCECPISILSVAEDVESEPESTKIVNEAKAAIEEMGLEVAETLTKVGNPVDEIIETGPDYSLIVLSESSKKGLKEMFTGSTTSKVVNHAYNSVLVVR